jgi:hypothetical protein
MLTDEVMTRPELVDAMPRYIGTTILLPLGDRDDARDRLIAFARAGKAAGAELSEHDDTKYAGIRLAFGPVVANVYADVAKVHEVVTVQYTRRPILAELTSTEDDTPQVPS